MLLPTAADKKQKDVLHIRSMCCISTRDTTHRTALNQTEPDWTIKEHSAAGPTREVACILAHARTGN
jgi:hypothetical protein